MIVPRATWGAIAQAQLVPTRWTPGAELIVHHTASDTPPANTEARQDYALARGFDRFHRWTRGWRGGIGYSFLVFPSGRILEGRGEHVGAHTVGANETHPAVALVGDYSTRPPSPAMRAAVSELAEVIGHRRLSAHRRFNPTSCPGDGAMRGLVELPLIPGAVAPPPVPPAGSTLRLYVAGHKASPWAGWEECAGPLQWIAREGLQDELAGAGRHAIAWHGAVWRGATDVTNVARSLVRRFL
jgi:hypothetical protein